MSRLLPVACIALLVSAGCSSGPAAVPIECVVTINGTPAADLMVTFTPAEMTPPIRTAFGTSGPDGKFTLTGSDGKPGAPPGNYKVTVLDNKIANEDEPTVGKRKISVNRIPQPYSSPVSTPLTITIEAGKREYEIKVAANR